MRESTLDRSWTDAGADAALLPGNATYVNVTDSRGRGTVVALR